MNRVGDLAHSAPLRSRIYAPVMAAHEVCRYSGFDYSILIHVINEALTEDRVLPLQPYFLSVRPSIYLVSLPVKNKRAEASKLFYYPVKPWPKLRSAQCGASPLYDTQDYFYLRMASSPPYHALEQLCILIPNSYQWRTSLLGPKAAASQRCLSAFSGKLFCYANQPNGGSTARQGSRNCSRSRKGKTASFFECIPS